MLFKEIIAVYSENHAKPINAKCSITDWIVHIVTVPLGLVGLKGRLKISKFRSWLSAEHTNSSVVG
jgi:hypothetical protein